MFHVEHCTYSLGAGGLAFLVNVADDQDHAWPQGCDIAVIVLQG
jgi:hypothetical protein